MRVDTDLPWATLVDRALQSWVALCRPVSSPGLFSVDDVRTRDCDVCDGDYRLACLPGLASWPHRPRHLLREILDHLAAEVFADVLHRERADGIDAIVAFRGSGNRRRADSDPHARVALAVDDTMRTFDLFVCERLGSASARRAQVERRLARAGFGLEDL